MTIEPGLIVELNFLFPNGKFKPHPAVIVSNLELFETEDFFYCVLISTKDYNSKYIFPLKNEMLTRPLKEISYAKCHIIGGYTQRDVLKVLSKIKNSYFLELLEKIKLSIF